MEFGKNQQQNDLIQSKEQLASHYALHVALQTMKERCLSLQQRLTAVEEENSALRKKYGKDQPDEDTNMDDRTEIELLREQVGELTRQKFQLTEHISMVASENRQLWSRLSKLTKDNQTLGISLNKIKNTLTGGNVVNLPAHQNLIRSKTFTQNSPNPILRQKMMQDVHTVEGTKNMDDLSLEEISLKDYTDSAGTFAGQNAQRVNNAEMLNRVAAANSMGFGYLNDESINTILQNDTKKCLDNMVDIKKELLRQQSDLKVALSGLRQRKVLELCFNCKNQSKKANTVDKNLGTSDEMTEMYPEHQIDGRIQYHRQESSDNDAEINELVGDNAAFMPIKPDQLNPLDISQQKKMASCLDKMCPMCGKIYSNTSSFEIFQDHVESHFIDDTELDLSVEKNFEFISNTVGQF